MRRRRIFYFREWFRHPGTPEVNLVRDGGVWGALGAITFPGSP